jgi:putative Mg2+ transporter-C (MgtC) family protein
VREKDRFRVRGLTSAACAFLAACLGIACGAGQWKIVAIALALAFLILTVGHHAEFRMHRALGGAEDPRDADPLISPREGREPQGQDQ